MRPSAWSWYQSTPGDCTLGYAYVGVVQARPLSRNPAVNQAKALPSDCGGWTPPWRWTTVGTPPLLEMAVGTVGSHGRMWRSGRWFSHVTHSGTPCRASMVGPGKVALSADVPNTNTVVAGRSRWNFHFFWYIPMVR